MSKIELKEIPIEKVLANFSQPREQFDKEQIKELAESILSNGLINPITVREDPKRKGKYMIVAGERRWRAHRTAKLKTIQAFVKEYPNDSAWMIESFIENYERTDLNSFEKARYLKKIWEEMGRPERQDFARQIGVPNSVITEHLSLIDDKTPKKVQEAVKKGKLAMRSASMIRELPKEEQEYIAEESIKRETGIGRKEVEEFIEERKEPIKYEETVNDITDNIISNFNDFKYNFDKFIKKINVDTLSKSKMNVAMTNAGLHIKTFKSFVNILRTKGAKPHPLILALIKENGKI